MNITKLLKMSPSLYKFAVNIRNKYRRLPYSVTIFILALIPRTERYSFARMFSFRYKNVTRAFDGIPSDQLGKTILFVSLSPTAREARMSQAANLGGWSIFLIYIGKPSSSVLSKFQNHICVDHWIQLVMVTWLFRGPLVHVFAYYGNVAYPFLALKHLPVVLDIYDPIVGFIRPSIDEKDKENERESIRMADGITHRDLRIKSAQKAKGFSMPLNNILIPDLLTNDNNAPISKKNGEIHVVSTGSISGPENNNECIMRTVTALANNKIHVHVFVSNYENRSDIECYKHLQNENPYFHIRGYIYGNEYWSFLSSCDFGLLVIEPHIFGEKNTGYTKEYLSNCGSSRLMDYIEANLGVIVSPSLKFSRFLASRYAPIVVDGTRDLLRNPRPLLEEALLKKEKVRTKNVEKITMHGASQRLSSFYDQVVLTTNRW